MDERQWLECTDPGPMLEWLEGKAAERELRLFACACCRRVSPLLADARNGRVIDAAERLAEGCPPGADPQLFDHPLPELSWVLLTPPALAAAAASRGTLRIVRIQAWAPLLESPLTSFEEAALVAHAAEQDERAAQANLLREIFGSPFRPLRIEPSWLTAEAVALLHRIYEERLFHQLPDLGPVLEAAGCRDAGLLSHLRTGRHVLECHVLDALLGKGDRFPFEQAVMEGLTAIQSGPSAGVCGIQRERSVLPWERAGALRRDCEPHRGAFLVSAAVACLVLALLLCLLLSALFGRLARPLGLASVLVALPLPVLAGITARRDLARMGKGLMDPGGEDQARAAYAVCWLAAVFLALLLPLWLGS